MRKYITEYKNYCSVNVQAIIDDILAKSKEAKCEANVKAWCKKHGRVA